ncbi:MAG TPA: hypothetical protein VHZ78_14470 [Rhizomicrobium sp.]|jgi:hypothetical protein|nr:hypothetical protein [Rhizomicrobium sp.]
MPDIRAVIAFAVLALGMPCEALAWGAAGHRMIGELAVRVLPSGMPAFLTTPPAVRQIGELAREPDRWRNAGPAHDNERDPGHFVHIADDLTVMGGPPLNALPLTRAEYDTALRAAGSNQYVAGYLPYAIVDGWQQLRMDFALWRVDRAGERFARTAAARAWYASDRRLRETLTIRDLGVWAHYVGDASQPQHASVHYDEWGAENPDGFSNVKGFHIRFEGPFVGANVTEKDLLPLIAPYRDCACTIMARTAAYLAASQANVVTLYRLEKVQAFDGTHPEGKAFAAARLAAAVSELRDMTLDAWRASADTTVGFHALSVKAVEAGAADPWAMMQGTE